MIRHTVVFKLKDQVDSLGEQAFFNAVKELTAIPGVQKFECMKQISPKNNFDFGLSMEFENAELYEQYNNHPSHVHFVQEHWIKSVQDFLEIDYEPLVN
ncbi:Dabb family protein [Spirosoma sp. HMF4905]|uniref:Dabb family protein n=1 Tax=Spirosoma arboris TaxID=2682092 RepID=A0A7K1SII0_9BACT|nr:Dabb family protein [Spirosoma arboris]MVM33524.1 Dabb family protein [Spirosoma arboris]